MGTTGLLSSCRQMRALGGDCYDFSCQADGQLAMLVGDASGKSVAATLMMASVQASLRTAAQFTADNLAALLRAVNVQGCASSLAHRYATLFLRSPVSGGENAAVRECSPQSAGYLSS